MADTLYIVRTPEEDMSLGLQPEHGTYRKDTDTNLVSLIDGSSKFGELKKESTSTESVTSTHYHVVKSETSENAEEHIELGRQEVVRIPDQCPNCSFPGETLTALTDIPHFKEVGLINSKALLTILGDYYGIYLFTMWL